MAKILVTGANGFIGAWISKSLADSGHEVFCLVRPTSDLSELEGVSYQKKIGDVTDLRSVQDACQGMDYVFHLAGVVAYRSADRPLMDKVNVQGTQNVIDACIQSNVKRLLHYSSVCAIGAGRSPSEVMNERSTYNLADLNLGYFETKRIGEELVVKAVKNGTLDAVIVNPSTVYGFGDAKKGSRKNQVKVAQGRLKFYPPGGVNVVAIEDVVQGTMTALHKGRSGERYILCGENFFIKDVLAMIAQAAGKEAPSIMIPSWLLHSLGTIGDLAIQAGFDSPLSKETAWTTTLYHWFDHTKATEELGFNPKPGKFAIQNSVDWMAKHGLLG